MGSTEWVLEAVLSVLLAATLFHAVRLERALGVLRRDRAALEELVSGFNAGTRHAEAGIERLRHAADGAGRQIARQVDAAGTLREDLRFLIERGERLADRLDGAVRATKALDGPAIPRAAAAPFTTDENPAPVRSKAERDLMAALRLAR